MATPVNQLPRFQLPARIRLCNMAPEGLQAGRILADRIAKLPGVEAVEYGEDTLPRQMVAYLHENAARRTIGNPRALLLCRLDTDGITVHGLDNWARHQVLVRGWGKLFMDGVLLFQPRNDDELDTCWNIVRQAYDALSDPLASKPRSGNGFVWDMPKFSRTTLQ